MPLKRYDPRRFQPTVKRDTLSYNRAFSASAAPSSVAAIAFLATGTQPQSTTVKKVWTHHSSCNYRGTHAPISGPQQSACQRRLLRITVGAVSGQSTFEIALHGQRCRCAAAVYTKAPQVVHITGASVTTRAAAVRTVVIHRRRRRMSSNHSLQGPFSRSTPMQLQMSV